MVGCVRLRLGGIQRVNYQVVPERVLCIFLDDDDVGWCIDVCAGVSYHRRGV